MDFRGVGPRGLKSVRKPKPGSKVASYDVWGTGYQNVPHKTGAYAEAVELPFASMRTMDEVEAHPWPSPDDFDKIIEMRSNSQDFEDITMRYRERKAEFEVQMDGLRSQRAELEKQLFI